MLQDSFTDKTGSFINTVKTMYTTLEYILTKKAVCLGRVFRNQLR